MIVSVVRSCRQSVSAAGCLAINEQRNTEREIWVTIIHLDAGGEDEDHDGFDESSIIPICSWGWVLAQCTCLFFFVFFSATKTALPSVRRRICMIVSRSFTIRLNLYTSEAARRFVLSICAAIVFACGRYFYLYVSFYFSLISVSHSCGLIA